MASNGDNLTLLDRARQSRRGRVANTMWDWPNSDPGVRWYGLTVDEHAKEARLDDAVVVECWKYINEETPSGLSISKEDVKYIKDDDIPAWLEQPPRDNRRPSAGLRLIHKFQPSIWESPFKQETFVAINHKFDLPNVFLHVASCVSGACGTFMSKDSRSVIFVSKRSDHSCNITIVLRHDFEMDTTVGYILSDPHSPMYHALLGIPQQFRIQTHPLLVPFLIVEQMLGEASWDGHYAENDIFKIEKATGHSYALPSDISGQDYRNLSKDLGRAATYFALLRSRVLAFKAMHELCSRQLNLSQAWIPKDKWENYAEPTRVLAERAEFTASHIEHLLLYRGLEMRLQAQQNLIFNLISQEDSRTNLQLSDEMKRIAIKTKRDGSVMKTIAFLGALFVPATFVSTLFAMPLFNWSAPTTSEIITNHFWIYGAVTGPLTVVTMAIVGYWILSRTQKNLNDKDSSSGDAQSSWFGRLQEKLELRKRRLFRMEDGL